MPTTLKFSPNRVGIRNSTDYSPFGVELDGRTVSLEGYRFGYQGSEKDNEFKGNGNSYTTEFRQLDPRLGRWLSVDPLFAKFPWQSSYCAFNNCPILLCDPLGLEAEGGPDDDKNGNEITRKVQESREVVVKGYPTKEQKRRRFWNRVWGGVNIFFGAMEASIGSGLIASGVGTPLGIVMLLHGADNAVAGISQITTGKKTVSITYDKAKKIAKLGGASDQTAEYIATFADASISIAGAGLASSVSRSLTRSAPKIGLEIVEESGNLLMNSSRQLQAKFKHASDFGILGNFSKANVGKFSSAVNQHINSAETHIINGTYRGQAVIHYLNPKTGLNVISSPTGQFISGWKLNPTQLQNVIKHGGL